ncbi:MAG: putative integral membrane protein (TIGR00698 family) [Alteromonadaceae bacterium]|jgi:uncharacterized integral membrane protein (TIGR00698 family)
MPTFVVLPVISMLAMIISQLPQVANLGLSALPLAILLGIVYGQLSTEALTEKALKFSCFCKQKLLRLGIILFGFNLSFQQIIAVGWQAVVIDFIVIITIFFVGTYLGIKVLKLPRDVAILTSVGSAICGAAAILATESMLKPRQQDVTVAIATVVLFGTTAMFIYPLLFQFVDMNDSDFGMYIGSTVHEVAQAVAAGQSISDETMQTAVVVKLIRVMLLAPFILMLSTLLCHFEPTKAAEKRVITIPWFVFGFVGTAAINSMLVLPELLTQTLNLLSQFLLATAMAAIGAQTRWETIKKAGSKPLLLAFILFLILMFGGYFLNYWFI